MVSKKAMEAGFLVATIITIVSFVLIGGTVQRFLSDSDEKQAERICHDSIALRAALTIRSGGTEVASTPPLCKTIDKKIKGDKEKIKQQVADKMARCWWMFGEGRYEQVLDKPELIRKALGIPKAGNDCFVCYTMLIEEDEIKEGPITSQDLAKYLSEKDYKKVKDKKYLDYIQSYGGPGSVAVLSNLEPRKAYGIAFFSKNKEGSGSWWTAVAAPLAITGTIACALAPACGFGALIVGSLTAGATSGAAISKAYLDFFGNDQRDVSIIVVDELNAVEQYGCVKDIAGE